MTRAKSTKRDGWVRGAFAGVLAWTCAGCAAFLAGTGIELVSMDRGGETLEVVLELTGHNSGQNTVIGSLYHVDVQVDGSWIQVAEGFFAGELELVLGESREYEMSLDVPRSGVPDGVWAQLQDPSTPIRLRGELRVRGGFGEAPAAYTLVGNGTESFDGSIEFSIEPQGS